MTEATDVRVQYMTTCDSYVDTESCQQIGYVKSSDQSEQLMNIVHVRCFTWLHLLSIGMFSLLAGIWNDVSSCFIDHSTVLCLLIAMRAFDKCCSRILTRVFFLSRAMHWRWLVSLLQFVSVSFITHNSMRKSMWLIRWNSSQITCIDRWHLYLSLIRSCMTLNLYIQYTIQSLLPSSSCCLLLFTM
jgi:hypothetical protein